MVVGFPDPPTPYYPTHLLANSTHKDFGRILRATHSAYVREKHTTLPLSGPMPSVTCRKPHAIALHPTILCARK